MSRTRIIPWLMLTVWASWLTAAQSVLVAKSFLGAWVPDAGIVLVVVCAARFQARDVPRAALLLGAVRCAFTIEPPTAVLAGFLATSLIVRAIGTYAEVTGPLARTGLAASLAALFGLWLVVCEASRSGAQGGGPGLGWAIGNAVPAILAGTIMTAIMAMAFGGALTHLPGLSPLRKRRW